MKDFFIHQNRNRELILGGVISLIDFVNDRIEVRVKGGIISVIGNNLVIQRFDENEIVIAGKICEVLTNVTD